MTTWHLPHTFPKPLQHPTIYKLHHEVGSATDGGLLKEKEIRSTGGQAGMHDLPEDPE